MNKTLLWGFLFMLFFYSILPAQTNEITKTDLFALGAKIRSSNITIYGVSLKTKVSDLLTSFHKSNADLEQTDNGVFLLELATGIVINTKDRVNIDKIIIRSDASDVFEGETSKFFKIRSYEDFANFLNMRLGKPTYVSHDKSENLEKCNYYYSNGFRFGWMNGFSINIVSIEILPEEKIGQIASEEGAKTLEDIQKIESTPIPLSKTGFRQTLWGMSKEQVRLKETAELIKEQKGDGATSGLDILMFKSNINGLNCIIGYYFANNRLTRARYLITEEHTNNNSYIDDFNQMKSGLSSKYGKPERDQLLWTNNLYKDNPDEYGMAVSAGHLKYVAEWYPEESAIQLLLTGDNFKITLWVEYAGIAFKVYEKSVMEKAKKDIW